MATKAELEAELAVLRAQLKERDEPRAAQAEDTDTAEETASTWDALALDLPQDSLKDLAKEIEAFAREKPLVTILAAVLVGYVIGRSR